MDFRGEKRKNDTHESTTDPEERLARKTAGQTVGWLKTIGGMRKMRVVGPLNAEGDLLFVLAGSMKRPHSGADPK